MDVEDTTKTDTRTETSDKPASQERPYTPPPDNPGSPGQPSRLESLRRAREQQKSRSQETQDTDTDSPPHEGRDDKVTTEQTGSGNEKTETSGKPEAGDQDRREDDDRPGTDQPGRHDKREQEPSSQDEGTTDARQPDSGTPGNRDRPQAQTAEQRADTRAEPADRPASPERQWTPPPDNPGSPGQPSRLESLARAREQQQAAAALRDEAGDGPGEPGAERNVEPASAQPEDDGVNTPAADKAEAGGSEQKADRPESVEGGSESGEVTRQDETGARTQPRDAGTPAGSTTGTDAPGGPAADEPEPRERPAELPRDSGQNPQTADGPSDDGHRTGPESAEQSTSPADGTDQPHPTDPQTEPGDNPTGQKTEAAEPAPDTGPHADDPREPSTDKTPPSSEEADQLPGSQESRGEQDGDHDKKADTEAEPSPNETNETDQGGKTNPTLLDARPDSQGRLSFEPRYRADNVSDTELAPVPPDTAVADSQPTSRDLDPIDPDKLHDDTGDPLETPEEQDLNEAGRDRWSRAERAKEGVDAARKLADKAKDFLKQPSPTGQAEVRDSSGKGPISDQPTNPADFVSNGVIVGVLVIGATRRIYMKIKNTRR